MAPPSGAMGDRFTSLFIAMVKSVQDFYITKILTRFFDWLFIERFEGAEHMPPKGPFVLASNHVSFPDAWLYGNHFSIHRKDQLWFLSRDDVWWGRWWSQRIIPRIGGIIIDWRNPAAILEYAYTEVLKKGWVVGVFPEASRNPDPHTLCLGKTGAVRLALQYNVPLIPAGYFGPNIKTLWDTIREYIFKRNRGRIIIGKEIDLSKYRNKPITKELLHQATDDLMIAIGKLCDKRPRLHKKRK